MFIQYQSFDYSNDVPKSSDIHKKKLSILLS